MTTYIWICDISVAWKDGSELITEVTTPPTRSECTPESQLFTRWPLPLSHLVLNDSMLQVVPIFSHLRLVIKDQQEPRVRSALAAQNLTGEHILIQHKIRRVWRRVAVVVTHNTFSHTKENRPAI